MTTAKRLVEVFTAGCPFCEKTVKLVRSLICPSCELQVYDLREGRATNECRVNATRYGITAVPAIAVNGVVLDCCRREPITAELSGAAGLGRA